MVTVRLEELEVYGGNVNISAMYESTGCCVSAGGCHCCMQRKVKVQVTYTRAQCGEALLW
jgi:hypothetical protein